jgi:hypothetical protein
VAQEGAMMHNHITVFLGGRYGVLEELSSLLNGGKESFGDIRGKGVKFVT